MNTGRPLAVRFIRLPGANLAPPSPLEEKEMDTAGIPAQTRRSVVKPALLWLLFCAGLGLQFFSPHLKVEHDSFVIPQSAMKAGSVIDPRALVHRERLIQGASAGLVLVGTIGLAICYREALRRSLSRK